MLGGLFGLLLCIGSTFASELPIALPEEVGFSSERLTRITQAMQKFVDDKQVAGLITMVARRGKVVYFEAIGMRDIESNKPIRRDSICRFYSMTKPITSVAAMMLLEDGKLGLNDPVSKFLPEFRNVQVFVKTTREGLLLQGQQREFTIRDLLRHTSGLTYGIFGDTEVDKRYRRANLLSRQIGLQDMVRKLKDIPLLYQPGTRWNYSVSSDVLARVVEVVSNQGLNAFFEERIFKPLGMKDTAFYVSSDKLDRFVVNYGPRLMGGLYVIDPVENSEFAVPPKLLSGGGGLVSTARDYMHFCQMMLNQGEFQGYRLLRPQTVAMMTCNQLPRQVYPIRFGSSQRQGVGFGFGFSVVVEELELAPYVPIGEYGWGGAACTHFWISPKDELVVIVLTQYMPFSLRLETAIKPIVYQAILDAKRTQVGLQ